MRSSCRRKTLVIALAVGLLGTLSWAVAAHKPTHVEASDGLYPSHVRITWHASHDAVRYRIFRRNANVFLPLYKWSYESIGDVTGPTTSFTDYDVENCVVYEYAVAGYSTSEGFSDYSDSDTGFAGLPPPAPAPVTTAENSNAVYLDWPTNASADTYHILRANVQAGPYSLVGTAVGSESHFLDAELEPGVVLPSCSDFWYKVQSCNGCGCGAESAPILGHAKPEVPAKATPTTDPADAWQVSQVDLTWLTIPGAVYYEIARRPNPNTLWKGFATSTGTSLTVSMPPSPECEYLDAYRIRGCNCVDQCGEWSVPLYVGWGGGGIPAPANLTTAQITTAFLAPAVELSWDPVAGADRYEVWVLPQAPDVANLNPVAVLPGPPFIDANSYECTTNYWVRACVACGCGPLGSTPAKKGPVTAPTLNVQASQGAFPGYTLVTWNPCPGATHYEVLRGVPDSGTESAVAWVPGYTTNAWDDFAPPSCQTYSYRVRGCNTCGCGPESGVALGFVGAPPTPSVLVTSSYVEDAQPVVVSWYLVSGATHYLIRRTDESAGTEEIVADLPYPYMNVVQKVEYADPPPAEPCAKYFYSVGACYDCACSWEEPQLGRFGQITIGTPTGLKAELLGESQALVSWDAVPSAVGYGVALQVPGGSTVYYDGVVSSPFTCDIPPYFAGLAPWFAVQALSSCGFSDWTYYVKAVAP